jgi:hypothetical protein
MSEENVELAHRAFDAFNRRDFDAFLTFMDADLPRLQRVQAGRRLLSSSPPPSAIAVRWSTSAAGAPHRQQERP